MFIHGSSLVFNADSNYIRIGLRLYFRVLFIFLALVGDFCCGNRVKLLLLNEDSVPISMMTGWLGLVSILKMWTSQKRIPAGFFGILMIVAELMSLSSDLLVSGLVRPTEIPGRCSFGQGIVLPENPVWYDSVPTSLGNKYAIASQAQATNEKNGGLRGLYLKVNEASNFRADMRDVIGHWNCVDIQHDVLYDQNMALTAVITDLVDRGYLYSSNTTSYKRDGYPDDTWDGLLAWGPSIPDDAHQLWDVKASMTYRRNGLHERKILRSYHCVMNAPPYEWVLKKIWPYSALNQWILLTHGVLEQHGLFDQEAIEQHGLFEQKTTEQHPLLGQKPTKPVTEVLSTILECMTMIGWQPELYSTPIGDPTQGCLIQYTEVPWLLFGFLLLATLSTLLMIAYWINSSLKLRSVLKSSDQYNQLIKDETPNDLVGWMTHAVREHVWYSCNNDNAKAIVLSAWSFKSDRRLGLQLSDDNPTRTPPRTRWRSWLPQLRSTIGIWAGGSLFLSFPRLFKQKYRERSTINLPLVRPTRQEEEGLPAPEALIRTAEGAGGAGGAEEVEEVEEVDEVEEAEEIEEVGEAGEAEGAVEATEATDHML